MSVLGPNADPAEALERYRVLLDEIRRTLAEFEGTPSYLLLSDLPSAGATERRYRAAAEQAPGLWVMLDAADRRLEKALEVAGERNRHGEVKAKHIGRLRSFLREPFAVAGLDGVNQRPMSLGALIGELRRRTGVVAEAVSEIEEVWTNLLPRIDAARATLQRLQQEADVLGVTEPLIGRARALADDLSERLVGDPADVHPHDGDGLDAQVAAAARQMAELRTAHDNLDADLNQTEELLASLRSLLVRAETARKESLAKVADHGSLVRVPSPALIDGPDGLGQRLDQLFVGADDMAWNKQRAMLDRWLESARKLQAQLERAEAANRKPLVRRDELRGRLRALVAKMAGTGRAEDLEIDELVQEVHDMLYAAPIDLARAEAKLAALATKLQS